MQRTQGLEIRCLRMKSDYTLRAFANKLGISAAYQSDIEHDRRRPPEKLLRRMADALQHVGATYEALESLDTRLDPDIRLWANSTPGVREMLREIRESGHDPREVLRELEDAAMKRRKRKE